MVRLEEGKVILTISILFVIGLFVFFVIFRSIMLINDLKSESGIEEENENEQLSRLLFWVPFGIGILYFATIGFVVWVFLKRGRETRKTPETWWEKREWRQGR